MVTSNKTLYKKNYTVQSPLSVHAVALLPAAETQHILTRIYSLSVDKVDLSKISNCISAKRNSGGVNEVGTHLKKERKK